jgi:hypothetical protein
MGGYGSGRRGGRAMVEGCASLLALDAKRAMRPVLAAHRDRGLRPGEVMNAGPIRFAWTREGSAGSWAAVAVSLELGPDRGHAWLTLEHHSGRRRSGPWNQRVRLEAAPCRFGGVRWWWVCPATGRRATKLYLPGDGARFLSRQAHGLAYASQREDEIDRAHRRAARLHGLLGSSCRSAFGGTPPKPKWMRWPTYERLAAELDEVDAALEEAMERAAARILA